MRFVYQSSLLICVLFAGCNYNKEEVLYFNQVTIEEIGTRELALGALIDTFDKDISSAFKPTCLKNRKAVKVLRAVRSDLPLPMINKYYFDASGQLIFTHYEWSQSVPGLSYQDRETLMAGEVRQFERYFKKHEQVALQLQAEMGFPIENDGALQKNKTSLLDFFSHKMKFYKGGKTVELRLIWSPKRGARFFKVFSKVYWSE